MIKSNLFLSRLFFFHSNLLPVLPNLFLNLPLEPTSNFSGKQINYFPSKLKRPLIEIEDLNLN